MWIVPTELPLALRGIGQALGGAEDGGGTWQPGTADAAEDELADLRLEDPQEALSRARAEAAGAEADAEGAARVALPARDVPAVSPDGPVPPAEPAGEPPYGRPE
jgi:hypothetical protein